MTKLSVVVPVMNQLPLARACFEEMVKNTRFEGYETEFIIIDNGSDIPLDESDFVGVTKIIRNDKNIGVYPCFLQGMIGATGDIVAFLHSDVVIWEDNWNSRVVQSFIDNPKLGLLGFIGSDEIDSSGGRGLGTMSNFQGFTLRSSEGVWTGSSASVHGKVMSDYRNAAVVDGCVMIIRRDAWNTIGNRPFFPMHHFYDRLISTQMLESDFQVGVLGIAFDHFSGQTVNQEQKYHDDARLWLQSRGALNEGEPIDQQMYLLAEKIWLEEYRELKKIVPCRV